MNDIEKSETIETPYVAPQFEVIDLQEAIGFTLGSNVKSPD